MLYIIWIKDLGSKISKFFIFWLYYLFLTAYNKNVLIKKDNL
jgi:hypothetical protein